MWCVCVVVSLCVSMYVSVYLSGVCVFGGRGENRYVSITLCSLPVHFTSVLLKYTVDADPQRRVQSGQHFHRSIRAEWCTFTETSGVDVL